jgi:hypothetical protein
MPRSTFPPLLSSYKITSTDFQERYIQYRLNFISPADFKLVIISVALQGLTGCPIVSFDPAS